MAKKDKTQDKLINLQAQQLAAQIANWAAQLDFQKERFRLLELPQFQQGLQLEVDKFAWQKAEDTWKRAYQEATLTGMYEGKPTTQWLMDQARLTGSFNGQRTLEGLLTDAQIKDMQDKMKLANDQFLAATTGYFNGQKTFDREKFETSTAMDAWKFIAGLSGASNAFKQARAIGSMPGGMRDLMAAAAGKYEFGSGTSVGSSGGHFNLDDMMEGYGGNFSEPGQPAPGQPGTPPPPPPTPGPIPVPPTPQPGEQAPTPPQQYAQVPGRGFGPAQWNDATRQAVAAWNAAHPGYEADGSQIGYHRTDGQPVTGKEFLPAQGPMAPGFTPYVPGIVPGPLDSGAGFQAPNVPPRGTVPSSPAPGFDSYVPPAIPEPTEYRVGDQVPDTGPQYEHGSDPYYATGFDPYGGGSTMQGTTYSPEGVQAPPAAYNYSISPEGSVAVYPPGTVSPPQTVDVSAYTPMDPLAARSVATGAQPRAGAQPVDFSKINTTPYQYGGGVEAQPGQMVLPNQINARNYGNMYQYQRDLLWANYGDKGWDEGLAQEGYLKSLPKYGGPSKGSIAF